MVVSSMVTLPLLIAWLSSLSSVVSFKTDGEKSRNISLLNLFYVYPCHINIVSFSKAKIQLLLK